MPVRPARQTIQSTLPYGVGYAAGTLPRLRKPTFAGAAGAGSSLAAARPGGFRDGAEDATTVPAAATPTTPVHARWLWFRPGVAATATSPSTPRPPPRPVPPT